MSDEQRRIRMSDEDRQRYQHALTTAYAEGRLDESELEERLSLVLDAAFEADVVPVVADLPARVDLAVGAPAPSGRLRSVGLAFMTAPIITTAIYAMTDFGGYFWPMWVWLGCSIPALTTLLARR